MTLRRLDRRVKSMAFDKVSSDGLDDIFGVNPEVSNRFMCKKQVPTVDHGGK